ncbi:MAG TPA: rho guanine nucleotide exchange factor, partial [archaeon]|nr:rho guanine nucleotide exchange factor [archaeon]
MLTESLNELLQTERMYVADLDLVKKVFIIPIKSFNMLTKEEQGAIFSNIELIHGVNVQMLAALEKNMLEPPPDGSDANPDPAAAAAAEVLAASPNVGKVFLDMAHYFKMYTVYCSNQPTALAAIDAAKARNAAFDSFLQDCLQVPLCRGLTLFSYLIKPVQRICKYPLLLNEILRHTPADSPDVESLRAALAKIQEVVDYVNEHKRVQEGQGKILEVQRGIEGGEALDLVIPTRRFLREVEVSAVRGGKPVASLLMLFNDSVLVLRPRSKPGQYHANPFFLVYADPRARVVEIADSGFELTLQGVESVALSFAQPDLRTDLLKEVRSKIKESQRKRLSAFQSSSSIVTPGAAAAAAAAASNGGGGGGGGGGASPRPSSSYYPGAPPGGAPPPMEISSPQLVAKSR